MRYTVCFWYKSRKGDIQSFQSRGLLIIPFPYFPESIFELPCTRWLIFSSLFLHCLTAPKWNSETCCPYSARLIRASPTSPRSWTFSFFFFFYKIMAKVVEFEFFQFCFILSRRFITWMKMLGTINIFHGFLGTYTRNWVILVMNFFLCTNSKVFFDRTTSEVFFLSQKNRLWKDGRNLDRSRQFLPFSLPRWAP